MSNLPEYQRLLKAHGRRAADTYLNIISSSEYFERPHDKQKCRHQWKPLYETPTDADFLKLFKAQKLDRFYQCSDCGGIGKRNDKGTITRMKPNSEQRAIAGRQTWIRNLRVYLAGKGVN
jgi:Zn-finger protein